MKLFSSLRHVLALAIGGLIATGSPFLSIGARAQTPAVTLAPTNTVIGGNGSLPSYGPLGDNGPALQASIDSFDVAIDKAGNIFVAGNDYRIRKIDLNGIITTFAGTGTLGNTGDGGPATAAQLGYPGEICFDPLGNLYFADTSNQRIRKISPDGIISAVNTGPLNYPEGIAFDSSGNLYIADTFNGVIKKITPGGVVTIVAGTGAAVYSGDDGPATSAGVYYPTGVAVDASGNIYIGDTSNNVVRRVTAADGIIRKYAGGGGGGDGGPATLAGLSYPTKLVIDPNGNLLIGTTRSVRIVNSQTGIIDSIRAVPAGFSGGTIPAAAFTNAWRFAVDPLGRIVVADDSENLIERIGPALPLFPNTNVGQTSLSQNIYLLINQSPDIISFSIPLGEGGVQEFTIGTISGCPLGAEINSGTICIIPVTFSPKYPGKRDTPLIVVTNRYGTFGFGLIGAGVGPQVAILPGIISSVAGNGTNSFSGDGGAALSAGLFYAFAVDRDAAGNMYIVTNGDNRVRKVATSGIITTVAGTGSASYNGDGIAANTASLRNVGDTKVDSAGNLYIADQGNNRIRKVDLNGIITTVAGNGSNGFSGDNGPATSAMLSSPTGITVDSAGNLYIAEYGNNRVRKVDVNGIITTFAGNGTPGLSGDNGPATSAAVNGPDRVTLDRAGNLYIADQRNNRIRKVDVNGIITTVAGGGSGGDGGPATSAQLNSPYGIVVDAAGNLYIADSSNYRVRKVDVNGIITAFAGNGVNNFSGDGGAATSASVFLPNGVALDSFGDVFITEYNASHVRKVSTSTPVLTFPDTVIGTASGVQAVTLSNIGNGELNFAGLAVDPDFFLDPSSPCNNTPTLGIGNSCTLAIGFQPQKVGPRTGTATVTDDALNSLLPPSGSGSAQIVQLNGAGLPAPTTSILSLSTSDTIAFGTTVTLTAHVTPISAGAATISGTLTLFDGATPLGTAPISATTGEASVDLSNFAVGVHSLTVEYSGDNNFKTSTSAAVPLTVTTATIAVQVISSNNPSNYGENVIFTATVPAGATGAVQFKDGATLLGVPVTISGTTASFATSTLIIGSHPIVAVYSGDGSHAGANSAILTQTVNPASLTVTAANLTRPFGEANPTLTYTITGFVSPDTQTVVSGTPAINTAAAAGSTVGSYPISLSLGTLAAANYTFSFAPATLTVTKATPGTGSVPAITLTCSPNPSVWGQAVSCTAVLPPNATGPINFTEGASSLGTGTIVDEHATFTTTQLAVATHLIAAAYGGDGNYNGAIAPSVSQVVNKATLSVIANDQQRLFGQPNPPLTSTITGFVNGDTSAVVTGAPVLTTGATTASPPGQYPITEAVNTLAAANYTFVPANGTLFVAAAASMVAITTSAPSVPVNTPVTFTATVPAGATGTVQFYDGTAPIGSPVPILNGIAALTTSTLTQGTHPITAVYSGDANFTTASSPVLNETITAPRAVVDFAIANLTPSQLIPPGASASYNISITSVNGVFTNVVTLTATNLPPNATFTYAPPTVTPGAAGATSSFAVTVPKQSAALLRSSRTPLILSVLLLPFAVFRRARGKPHRLLLWLLVTLTVFGSAIGCGVGGYFSLPQQTYVITVTGTSGTLVHSTTATLTVE
jgi:sugar lactone lactonase YvrE